MNYDAVDYRTCSLSAELLVMAKCGYSADIDHCTYINPSVVDQATVP